MSTSSVRVDVKWELIIVVDGPGFEGEADLFKVVDAVDTLDPGNVVVSVEGGEASDNGSKDEYDSNELEGRAHAQSFHIGCFHTVKGSLAISHSGGIDSRPAMSATIPPTIAA